MALNPGQQAVVTQPARFRVVIAGRRWGKTYLSIREMARHARQPNQTVWYIAPTYRMCKQIVWSDLKERLLSLRWVRKINESDLTITLKNGSTISLRGADNPDSLRGVSISFMIMDEFAMIDPAAWTEVLRPTLSDREGEAMFISTPQGRNNWAFDLYQRGLDPQHPQWESFKFTTLEGGNVTAEEIEQARADLDERTFRSEYEASWETYANRVFYAFDAEQHVRAYTAATPEVILVGMDFNIDPMTAVIMARQGDTLHIMDEIVMFSSNTNEMVAELQSRYPRARVWVYPDPAARQRRTSAGGATDLSILTNAGFVVKAPAAHTAIRDGINAVNARLRSAAGEINLYVDPRCRHAREALEKHSYKAGTSQPDKDSGFDHMADAIRYAVDYLFPVRRTLAPEATLPQRWGHNVSTH